MSVRIEEAKRMLTTSNLRIYEIGNLCGIDDTNYFIKIFKRYTGVTPRRYREGSLIND